MPRTIVPAEGGALPAGRLFIEVTPGMRRALELLADATILVLDEIDGDVDHEDADEDSDMLLDRGERDDADDELTANETAGRGFYLNMGPRADDAEDDDPGGCEHDGREPDNGY